MKPGLQRLEAGSWIRRAGTRIRIVPSLTRSRPTRIAPVNCPTPASCAIRSAAKHLARGLLNSPADSLIVEYHLGPGTTQVDFINAILAAGHAVAHRRRAEFLASFFNLDGSFH